MTIVFNRDLIEKCQKNAPRYTSYPTADRFNTDYTKALHLNQLQQLAQDNKEFISLYIHIPFCNTLCLYCGCNKIITNDRTTIKKYINYLDKEIALYYAQIKKKFKVVQLHFGGGSPSWMDKQEVKLVMDIINKYFDLSQAKEIAMEIDPRHCGDDYVLNLKQLGFNRISLGIQDFNPKVQKAVNRIQSFEESKVILDAGKKYGFNSTNVDLIYGLPHQTKESFDETINKILELNPDRIALFNYAHIPQTFMPQQRIKDEDLPTSSVKLDILQSSVNKLGQHGYKFIGMDHFALADDDLSKALASGNLQRNFQGYSTFADTDMVSFGVSSIGYIHNGYYQNAKDLTSYYLSLDNNQLPNFRGFLLSNDDLIRKYVISEIMCKYQINYKQIEQKFNIVFKDYFATEIKKLDDQIELNLVTANQEGFNVTEMGRFLIRNIAVIFDNYFAKDNDSKKYSKVI
jgi:oxygen-independent coproporphyrinogen-3 oxidase